MSFPRYPSYKPSSVQWLGEVPKHWNIKPMWTFFRRVKRVGFQSERLLSVYRDYGVIPKDSRDDNFNKPSEDLSPYQLVAPGDLVINKMKAWQGSVAISDYRGIVSPAYFVFEATHASNSRFLHYLFRSPRYIGGYFSNSKGVRPNQWDLEPEVHSRFPVLVPPASEQSTIANFLDSETSKIDALVAEQEKLIALLIEKRKAVISNAVTKGLKAELLMRNSGIEWLYEIPGDWKIIRFGSIFSFSKGLNITKENLVDKGVPCINYGEIHSKFGFEVDPKRDDLKCVSEEYLKDFTKSLLEYGDFIFADTSEDVEGSGNFTYYNSEAVAFAGYHTILNKPKERDNNPRYLAYFFDSNFFRAQIQKEVTGTKVYSITKAILKDVLVLLPPIEVQNEIVGHLDSEIERIRMLISEAQKGISLLQERRTALISAAVIGQIDVRQAMERKPA